MTSAYLDAQVRAAAASLKAFGIRPGDNVALLLPNCPQHLIAVYAITRLGGRAEGQTVDCCLLNSLNDCRVGVIRLHAHRSVAAASSQSGDRVC